MALLDCSDWYDIARLTGWTPKYITEEELFPEPQSSALGLPFESWDSYDERYKVIRTHPTGKDAGGHRLQRRITYGPFWESRWHA